MINFILATKKEKLDTLSEIIGFSNVTKIRDVLRKIVGELSRDIKRGNFKYHISNQKAKIIEYLGSAVNSEEQFCVAANETIRPLKLDMKINKLSDIESILKLIQRPGDEQTTEMQLFYKRIADWHSYFLPIVVEIESMYEKYFGKYQKIVEDIEKLNKILLENLLNEGVKIIKGNVIREDQCPLCLQPKNRSELLKELEARIQELQKYKKEKLELDELRESLRKELREPLQNLSVFFSDKRMVLQENKELKEKIGNLKSDLEVYLSQLIIEISSPKKLQPQDEILIKKENLNQITDFCNKEIDDFKKSIENDSRSDIQNKLILSREAYMTIVSFEKEKEILERQQKSMELIYTKFLKKQKEALENFFTRLSGNINHMYQFMNPDEKVEDIKLVPLEKDDELQGITLEFKFYKKLESPPQKYLSESHLNCLGIVFFLTSVMEFNKKNKFFILDDVISSYDTNHRKRFADLLIEKFSDYQIILLTHEHNWFELMRKRVQGKKWQVNTLKWHTQNGTYIDEPLKNLRERIDTKISANETDGLGNDIRKYLENLLKQIAFNLALKVAFRFNDKNENRMSNELITALQSKFKSQNSMIKINQQIERMLLSLFIGNKESHDSLFNTSFGDLLAFWKDVENFEKLFRCDNCGNYFKSKNYNSADKKIKCGCGNEIMVGKN